MRGDTLAHRQVFFLKKKILASTLKKLFEFFKVVRAKNFQIFDFFVLRIKILLKDEKLATLQQ